MIISTRNAMKAFALSACAIMATNAMADDAQKYYLSDVYTVEDLNSDIFGVPMRIDHIEGAKYSARYYNEKANNEVYILGSKTDFSDVIGAGDGNELAMGSALSDVKPFVLPEANKYYQIDIDINDFNYSIKTYEVADYMDPVLWDLNSTDVWNVWHNYVYDEANDTYKAGDDAWCREFYFGYTCSEYLLNDNNEYVDANGNVVMYDKEAGIDERVLAKETLHRNVWAQDEETGDWYDTGVAEVVDAEQLRWCALWHQNPNNKHQYIWDAPKHFVAGQKLNFIFHNWHESGWWNNVTWRTDDEEECDIFYFYGSTTSKAYLDWAWGEGNYDFQAWYNGEDERKRVIFDGGDDAWCKPTVATTGEYVMTFDTHLGRAKLVPATGTDGIEKIVSEEAVDTNAPVEYYNLQGIRMNANALTPGIYIQRQGNKATKVLVR